MKQYRRRTDKSRENGSKLCNNENTKGKSRKAAESCETTKMPNMNIESELRKKLWNNAELKVPAAAALMIQWAENAKEFALPKTTVCETYDRIDSEIDAQT